ncbi:hypothetical protein F4679DRAFT_413884 [Xylaria curta]|nr:hypothetical protein F4679DRAFT_413884 [Xylaria curta]
MIHVIQQLKDNPDAGFAAHLKCIGVTPTLERGGYWTRAKQAFVQLRQPAEQAERELIPEADNDIETTLQFNKGHLYSQLAPVKVSNILLCELKAAFCDNAFYSMPNTLPSLVLVSCSNINL